MDAMGDCYFDAFLAQLQDPRIRMTIDPVLLRGITTPQGFKHYILIRIHPVNQISNNYQPIFGNENGTRFICKSKVKTLYLQNLLQFKFSNRVYSLCRR